VLSDNQALKEQKINEFEFGQLPNGRKIGRYASEDYSEYKYLLNPLAGEGNVDLIVTGRFVNSFFVRNASTNGAFIFGAKDDNNLLGSYGKDILGINKRWWVNRQKEVYLKKLFAEIKSKYKIA